MEKLKCKVIMVPVEKASENSIIEYIDRSSPLCGQYYLATREIGINSSHLIDNYKVYDLFLVSKRKIENGDKYLRTCNISENEWIVSDEVKGEVNDPDRSFKIESTSNKGLNLPIIPKSFIEKYILMKCMISNVYIDLDRIKCMKSDVYNKVENEHTITNCITSIPKVRKDNSVIISKVRDTFTKEDMEKAFRAGAYYESESCQEEYLDFNQWFDKEIFD